MARVRYTDEMNQSGELDLTKLAAGDVIRFLGDFRKEGDDGISETQVTSGELGKVMDVRPDAPSILVRVLGRRLRPGQSRQEESELWVDPDKIEIMVDARDPRISNYRVTAAMIPHESEIVPLTIVDARDPRTHDLVQLPLGIRYVIIEDLGSNWKIQRKGYWDKYEIDKRTVDAYFESMLPDAPLTRGEWDREIEREISGAESFEETAWQGFQHWIDELPEGYHEGPAKDLDEDDYELRSVFVDATYGGPKEELEDGGVTWRRVDMWGPFGDTDCPICGHGIGDVDKLNTWKHLGLKAGDDCPMCLEPLDLKDPGTISQGGHMVWAIYARKIGEKYEILPDEFRVNIHWEDYTEESVEAGDAEERGTEIDGEVYDLDDILSAADSYETHQPSASEPHPGMWWHSSSNEPPPVREHSLHVNNLDETELDEAQTALLNELITNFEARKDDDLQHYMNAVYARVPEDEGDEDAPEEEEVAVRQPELPEAPAPSSWSPQEMADVFHDSRSQGLDVIPEEVMERVREFTPEEQEEFQQHQTTRTLTGQEIIVEMDDE